MLHSFLGPASCSFKIKLCQFVCGRGIFGLVLSHHRALYKINHNFTTILPYVNSQWDAVAEVTIVK